MGIFEIEKLTCGDCVWGAQCHADYICEDFDPAVEIDHCWSDKVEFELEYEEYIRERQCTCKDNSPILLADFCKGVR